MFSRFFKGRTIPAVAIFLLFLLPSINLQAQLKIFGTAKKYAFYSAAKGDTPYSVAKNFNIPIEDFYKYNPLAKTGIREGEELMIPAPFSFQTAVGKTDKNSKRVKYVVERRETLYSIAKTFNTTQEEILRLNPSLTGSLSNGTVLIIPGPASLLENTPTPKEENLQAGEYRIVKGDNYFQLQQRFGVSQSELENLNPELKNGFKLGMVIKIPSKKTVEAATPQAGNHLPVKEIVKPEISQEAAKPMDVPNLNKRFNVGIYLPFCQNISDSIRVAQHSNSYLDFYSGILLASDVMTQAGMKLKLYVYDTYHDSDVVNTLVKKPEFLSLDLIIGPVYPNDQKIVAELSFKNRIPMVSPLSPDNRFVLKTPGYYLINPGKRLRLASTADYISTNFASKNLIMLHHGAYSGDGKYLFDRLTQKLGARNLRSYNILTEDALGLEELLKDSLENVFILAEGSEANVSVAMTRLNTVSKSHKVRVIGLQEYTKMQSIDIEYMHNTNLLYLAPFFIDYGNPKVNKFIEKYRLDFGSEPTQYSFQGYDIALHFFASLVKAGKNFPATNPNPGVDLLQAEYNFLKPSQLGGYINGSFYVVEYTNNYEVRIIEKIKGSLASEYGDGRDSEKAGFEQ